MGIRSEEYQHGVLNDQFVNRNGYVPYIPNPVRIP